MGHFWITIALFLFPLIGGLAHAKNTDPFHSLGAYQVGFKDLHGLTPVEGLWGVGFSVVSEMGKQGSRSSVAVFDTELTNVHFDLKSLEKNQKAYYLGRKKWIEKMNQNAGEDTLVYSGDLPFRTLSFGNSTIQGYRVGFRYRMKAKLEAQYSYYLVCSKRVFHLKSIFPVTDSRDVSDPLEKVISGFQCRKDPEKVGQFNAKEIKDYWKKANSSPIAKKQVISALRDFVLEYENAHASGDQDSRESMLDPIKNFLKSYSLFESAHADDPGRCFNAGWPSQWTIKNGSKTCARPSGIDGCGAGSIKCNPMVFGEVCISDSLRTQATQACNAEYSADSAKHDAEIQALVKNDSQALLELESVADTVCSGDPYRGSNYGLCTTLYERLSKIDPAVPPPVSKGEVTPEKINPKDYDDVHELTQNDLNFFEHCYTDEKRTSIVPTVVVGGVTIDCVATQKRLLSNLKALEKIENDPKLAQAAGGACPEKGGPVDKNVAGALDAMKDQASSCTAKEKAAQGSCGKDILCSAGASVVPPFISAIAPNLNIGSCNIAQDGCLTHAATGVVEALWGTIKGILGLAYDVVEGVVSDTYSLAANGAKSVANFFGATYELEDASSFKSVQLAQTGTGMLNDFISDPGGTMKKLFNGIWEGINQFMKTDVFCSKWSGVPHLSTCTEPSSGWECMSCKQKLNGVCTVVGYVASEVVAAIFTGGISGAAEAAGIGAQVGVFLSRAQKLGKLKGARLLEEFPLLAKTGTKMAQAGTKAAEGTKFVTKGLTKLGKELKLGTKAVLGGSKALLASLGKLAVVKAPVKVVKLTGQKLQSFIATHNAYMKKMTAMGRDMGKTFVTGRTRELASTEKIIAKTADLGASAKVEKGLKTTETASLSPVMQDALKLPPEQLGYKDYFDFKGRLAKSNDPRKTRLLEVQKSAFDDFSNQVLPKFNKPGERDAFLKKMHSVHETCCVDPVTLKPYGDKVKALQDLKNQLIAKGFSKDEAFKLIDGISNKDVMLLGNPGSNLEDFVKLTNPKDAQTWINGAEPAEIEGQLKDLIAQRNDVRTRYFAGDSKLQKEYKDLDAKVKGLEVNYLLQKKLGTKSEDWKEMFKAKLNTPSSTDVAPKIDPQVQAYSKSVDQSIEALNDYNTRFSGSGMQDDLTELGRRAPSSNLKVDLETRIAEREAALQDLEAMKKAHAGKFSSSGLPRARDAEAAIDIRARSLRENLEKLKSEKKSLENRIYNANQRIEGITTGDYREYALKNKLEGENPYDPNFNNKVQEQIEDLKRMKANFKPEDLPSLKKVDVDAEIKRLEEFLKKAESRKPVSGGTAGGASGGKTIELSKDGKRSPDFQEKVTAVKSGDQIKFSDGSTFQVKSRLGGESSTEIFETADGKVIRVNKRSNETGQWTVDSYRKGYEELKKTEIPIVKVLDPKKASTEYVQVEKFNKKYDLDELYKKYRSGDVKLPEFQSKLEEFEKFIAKTKDYTELEDFHPGQVVYDQDRGWLLADYGSHNKKFTGNGNATAVDGWGKYLPKDHLEYFQKVIRDARSVAP